jgi:ParB family chromosome partitioning protein
LRLHPDLRHALINEEISSGHAKILVGLNESEQCYYLPLIIKQQWSVSKLNLVMQSAKNIKKSNHSLMRSRDLMQLERDLGDYLGCDVVIDYHDGKKCDLQLKCFNLELLDGVLQKIGYKN